MFGRPDRAVTARRPEPLYSNPENPDARTERRVTTTPSQPARRRALGRGPIVVAILLGVGGCASAAQRLTPPVEGFVDAGESPAEPVAQLRAADLPVIGSIAVHSWLVTWDAEDGAWHRWEVWQSAGSGPTDWEHVRKDMMGADAHVGGGPTRVIEQWRGDEARRIIATLEADASSYPHRDIYIPWPGPNCNTFTAWVLDRARVPCDLPPRAIGKDYRGPIGASLTGTGTGIQVETPLLGAKVGLADGLELHLLCLTFGVDLFPPALKTPVGRFGLPEDEPDREDDPDPSRGAAEGAGAP